MKFETLDRTKVRSIVGAVQTNAHGHRIAPVWKRGNNNTVFEISGLGDSVIGFPNGYEVHGDLLFTVGWNDGMSIHRLQDDGSLVLEWNNNGSTKPLYRDTTSTYDHMNNIVLSKTNYKAVIMSYNVNGYSIIDYSGLVDGVSNGGEAILEPRPPSQYFFTNGVNIDRAGYYYASGLCAAGDWIYIGDYDATHRKKFPRKNIVTGVEELLDGDTIKYPGSLDMHNGYRTHIFYDEHNDRIYYFSYYDGPITVILNASTNTPQTLHIDAETIGLGDDMYEVGLFVPDPVNNPNIIVYGAESRIGYIDYTPCFTGDDPIKLGDAYTEATTEPGFNGAHFRVGTKYQTVTNEHTDKFPGYPNFIPTSPDRGRNQLAGWMCFEHPNIYQRAVGVYSSSGIIEDTTTGGRGSSVRIDYGTPPVRMQSPNGTFYWILMGYGNQGYKLRVYDNDTGQGLIGDWEIEYGTFTLPGSANIDEVGTNALAEIFVPGSCSISLKVSNDGGTTWENYTGTTETTHSFSSTGNSLRVKLIATGYPDKAPYRMGLDPMVVAYRSKTSAEKNPAISYKRTKYRLRRKKL